MMSNVMNLLEDATTSHNINDIDGVVNCLIDAVRLMAEQRQPAQLSPSVVDMNEDITKLVKTLEAGLLTGEQSIALVELVGIIQMLEQRQPAQAGMVWVDTDDEKPPIGKMVIVWYAEDKDTSIGYDDIWEGKYWKSGKPHITHWLKNFTPPDTIP